MRLPNEWEKSSELERFDKTCWHEAGHALAMLLLDYEFEIATAVDPEKPWYIKGFVKMVEGRDTRSECDLLYIKCAGVVGELLRENARTARKTARKKGWHLLANGTGLTDNMQMKERFNQNYAWWEFSPTARKKRIKDHVVMTRDLLRPHRSDLEKLARRLKQGTPLGYEEARLLLM